MRDLFLFALLIGNDDFLASCILHLHRAAGALRKILRRDLTPVDQRENQSISQYAAQLLHDVQGQRGSAWSQGMEESHLWIEAHAFRRSHAIVQNQCVEERHQRIDWIRRWTPVPAIELEGLTILFDHAVEGREIRAGGLSFDAAQRF